MLREPALSLPEPERSRVRRLDKICADLEDAILEGHGDLQGMREEYRACQNEMRELEAGHV